MKSKLTRLEGTSKQFNIEVAKQDVDKVFEEVLIDIRKEATLPGFRKGNAPMDIIKKKFMEEAREEVKKRLIPEAYQQALDEHGVMPVSYPEVWDVKFEPSGNLTFKAKSDAEPDFQVARYKEIKVTREKIGVGESEIEEAMSRVRGMFAELVDVDRPAGKGDLAACDEEVYVEGKLLGKKRENLIIEVDKDASPFGIGGELLGTKPGDKKDISVDIPQDHQVKEYAGKKLLFKIEVKGVKEKKLPELDDELAKKLGKEKMDEVRQEIQGRILEGKENDSKVVMKDQIVSYLLKKHSFDLPPVMVKRQHEVLLARAEDDLKQKGVSPEDIASKKDELRTKLLEDARDKVKLYFVLDKIAAEEKIGVTEEDVEAWFRSLAASLGKPYENVRKYYEEHGLVGGLEEQLREEKTLEFLLEQASVNEK
ncbi:MAG: trigger factor [Candidatus Omnitrophica bacterium]|nr:trigger factor [Candidatus Omnitrophota bacterium]